MPRRNPIIFWLLLAATLTVDAAAATWILRHGGNADSVTVYLALTIAQLNALCVWVVLLQPRIGPPLIIPFSAGLVASIALAVAEPRAASEEQWEALLAFAAIYSTHVAVVLAVLAALKPTKFCASFSPSGAKPRWQFSITHLFVVMTCVALLCGLLRKAEMLAGEAFDVTTLPLANIMLFLLVLAAVQFRGHILLRFATVLGAALAIAAICEFFQIGFADDLNFFVYAIIQAIVLWAWLEVMRPVSADAAAAPVLSMPEARP